MSNISTENKSDDLKQAELTAIRLLSKREYTAQEITNKLKNKGYDSSIINKIIIKLQKNNWQSDLRYACMFFRHGIHSSWGPNKIKYQMQQKGIATEIINNIFDNTDDILENLVEDLGVLDNSELKFFRMDHNILWNNLAKQVALKKFGSLAEDCSENLLEEDINDSDFKQTRENKFKTKAKIQRFLYNRGFEQEQLNHVINQLIK